MRVLVLAIIFMLLPFNALADVFSYDDAAITINEELQNYTSFDVGKWVVTNFLHHKEVTAWGSPIAGSEPKNYLFHITISPYSDISGCKHYGITYSTVLDKKSKNILIFRLCEGVNDKLILHISQKIIKIDII